MVKQKKIRLEYVSETFSYDEEKGTTKCTLVYRPHIREFAQIYGIPINEVLLKSPNKYKSLIDAINCDEFTVTGVATCSKEDFFNKEIGEKIARHRARYRAEKRYNRCLEAYLDCLNEIAGFLLCPLRISNREMRIYNKMENYYKNEF